MDKVKDWLQATRELINRKPRFAHTLLNNVERREWVKLWWRYGMQAGGAESKWITLALKQNALSDDGIIALECMRQGREGVPWGQVANALKLEAEFPAHRSGASCSRKSDVAARRSTSPELQEPILLPPPVNSHTAPGRPEGQRHGSTRRSLKGNDNTSAPSRVPRGKSRRKDWRGRSTPGKA